MNSPATIHASAVLVGPKAALIRGPAGSGKSLLVWNLIVEAHGILRFSKLVGDDRVHVEACSGRLLVRPAKELAGMIEVHGLGIRHLDFEPLAAVGLIIDLAASDADRSPSTQQAKTTVNGVTLPRLAVAEGRLALPLILGFLRTRPIDLQ